MVTIKRVLTSKKNNDDDTVRQVDRVVSLHEVAKSTAQATPPTGLVSSQIPGLRAEYGFNEVLPPRNNIYADLAKRYMQPVPLLMLVAIILSAAIQQSEWLSFALLFVELNLIVYSSWKSEVNTASAIDSLQDTLAPEIDCKRDGEWTSIKARELVPGDIVLLKGGVVVPADALLRGEGEPLKLDESALTGESLAVTKKVGDSVLSGAVVVQGELEAQIYATGENTLFGKSLALVNTTSEPGRLQRVTKHLQNSILAIGGMLMTILFLVQLFRPETVDNVGENFRNVFVLLIAGAPVTLPVVVTTVLAVGAKELARRKAVVSRLSAIEELAGIDVLCSDKTGTLTLNKLEIDDPFVMKGFTDEDILRNAVLASRREGAEAIDTAIFSTTPEDIIASAEGDYEVLRFVPFNPTDKKTEAVVKEKATGRIFSVSKGSPDVINKLCHENQPSLREVVDNEIIGYASRGLRTLGVATKDPDTEKWQMVGLLSLLDPPRHDTAEVIDNAGSLFVDVKMITGDQLAIAIETARRLGMGASISGPEIWRETQAGHRELPRIVEEVNGFAGVFPEQKFKIVEQLQANGHVVGMTGDGVNDAAALKRANVGIAVAGATEAAKGASDIVLSEPGLGTIIIAINRARKTFLRLQHYVIYRIYVSAHIYAFFFLLSVALRLRFPSWALVILSLVKDVTIATSSKDKVPVSQTPLSWKIGRLTAVSLALATVAVLESVLFVYLASDQYGGWWSSFGIRQLDDQEVQAAIWLQ